jgi:class 3 adenylate cyclase/WD40 repeat protein/energy-coupling factor transporter ATP-binding protein EcfA2
VPSTRTVTILFCDLVGSTALMTRLGDDENDRLRRRLFVALREAVAANRGDEVKSAGDGMMVAFPASAADAVSCAVAMQRAVARLGATDPLLGLAIRVGLSSGEASHENNDWFGVPIVEAARLEHAARTGQILCADVTRVLVGNRGGHAFTPVGALELKGLPEPLAACEVAWEPDPGLPAIPMPSGLAGPGLPFAGRATELAALNHAWEDALAGQRRFVLISGEQGIGKTRLAAQFAAAIHGQSFVVLYGRSETDREIPYQPFAEALRWYVLAGQPPQLREQIGRAGGELTRIVPALRLRLPDLPEPMAGDPATERHALFDAVLHTLTSISERSPVLLVVDDLEQAEAPTLALLRHLVTSPEQARVLVVGLAGEVTPGSPWATESEAFSRLPGCVPIALHGLAEPEVASLLARVEGPASTPALAARIHRETEGSPRFVSELVARLHESDAAPETVLDAACPYMGLRSYEAADSGLYFGRDEVIGALLGRLSTNRLLSVVGASGNGKSSLVRAGLVPRLRMGALPGSREWEVLIITPGAHPLAELASRLGALANLSAAAVLRDLESDARTFDLTVRQALANRPDSARVLLVADQFEELFTLCRDDAERQRFIDALLGAIGVPGGRTMAILAMRADFYGEAARYPGLAEALEASHALLGPMSQDDLRSVVERPAAATGLRIEPGLTDRILRDVGDEPGGLPLLSHALLETWKRREGRTLTANGYAASGGVRGAIAQTADAAYTALSQPEQALARNLFVRLTELGEGTEDTRRRVHFSEAAPVSADGEAARAVINRLADARLLTTAEDSVEVAHEALIREWPRLRAWLDDDREGLRIGRHLTESAQSWERLGRDEGELYRGARLTAAAEWHDRANPALNPLERQFLDASRALHERELLDQRKRVRRLKIGVAALAASLVVAIAGVGLAVVSFTRAQEQRDDAKSARDDAAAQRDTAEAAQSAEAAARSKAEEAVTEATLARLETEVPVLTKTNRSLAFALAAAAYRLQPGPRTSSLMNVVLADDIRYLHRIWPAEGQLAGFAFSKDGKYLATVTTDGLVELRDRAADRVVATAQSPKTTEISRFVDFARDGTVLVVGGPSLIVFDVPSMKPLDFGAPGSDRGNFIVMPDGRQLISNGSDGLRVHDLVTGTTSAAVAPPEGRRVSGLMAIDAARNELFIVLPSTAGGTTAIGAFDLETLQLKRTLPLQPGAQIASLVSAPDGLLTSHFNITGVPNPSLHFLAIRDPQSGDVLAGVNGPTVGFPGSVDYSFELDRVAAGYNPANAGKPTSSLYSPRDLSLVGLPFPVETQVWLVSRFGPGSKTLYTYPLTAGLEEWALDGKGLVTDSVTGSSPIPVTMAPDGSWFLKQESDGNWSRWSLPGLRKLNGSTGAPGPGTTYGGNPVPPEVSADGRMIATTHAECPPVNTLQCVVRVLVWDPQTGKVVAEPYSETGLGLNVGLHLAFHPTEPLIAITTFRDRVLVRATGPAGKSSETEFTVRNFGALFTPNNVKFVATGTTGEYVLAVYEQAGTVVFWDYRTPAELSRLPFAAAQVKGYLSAPSGELVLGLGNDINLYRPGAFLPGSTSNEPIRTLKSVLGSSFLNEISISGDGKRMVVALLSGSISVLDLETGKAIGSSFQTPQGARRAELSPDGTHLLVSNGPTTVYWDLDSKLWFEKACFAAGRNLTEAEWTKYFPGRDYEATCPQWPAKPKT